MGMPEILASAFAAIQPINGIEVTYYRSEQFANLTVIPGRTLGSMIVDTGDISTKVRQSDFLIKRTELVLDGAVTTPVRGDRIITLNGDVFEVLPFGAEPEYRASDPYNVCLRVHVKLIETDAYLTLDDGTPLELDNGTFLVLE